MIRELRQTPGEWRPFRQLARRLRGDEEDEHLLAGVAGIRPHVFAIHQDSKVKLKFEAMQAEAPPPADALHLAAANAVMEYAGQLEPSSLRVPEADEGRRVRDRFVHGLKVEIDQDDFKLADDTPVRLLSTTGRKNLGHVAGASRDESILYVAFRDQVLPIDLPAQLEVSRSKTFITLAYHLRSLRQTPTLGLTLQGTGPTLTSNDSRALAAKLSSISTPWTRLLWGPPGAGKTHCIAELSALLLRGDPDARVLIVAPSNVAVDAAVCELLAALERDRDLANLLSARKIVRYGYPRDERILSRSDLFGPEGLEELSRKVHATSKTVRELSRISAPELEIAAKKAELRQLQEEMKQRLAAHLQSARIVLTTVASTFSGSSTVVEAGPWQTVIVDEASMVGGAIVLALASLASHRLLLSGDPRQLSPIVEWRRGEIPSAVERWLARDPYEIVGVSAGTGHHRSIKTDDPRMARVLSQRRCHPRIWSLVSPLYPDVESVVDQLSLELIAKAPPLPGEAAVLLDVSSELVPPAEYLRHQSPERIAREYLSACRSIGGSWENPPTAWLAIDVVREIRAQSPNATIAIITPYRRQVRLLRNWLREEKETDDRLGGIEVGTVHSFQGGEADVVVFDIVDGPPRMGLGKLSREDAGMRLVNVALTRARGKVVIIADKNWLFHQEHGRAELLWNILFDGAVRPETCTVRPLSLEFGEIQPPLTLLEGVPESPIEVKFVSELRKWTAVLPQFVLQHRISDEHGRIVSRADIAFPAERLAVFCDGARYHLQSSQWQRDLRQRRELTRLGWRCLAFTGAEITYSAARCVEDLILHLRPPNLENTNDHAT